MSHHSNAALTSKGRLLIAKRVLQDGWSLAAAARSAGVSQQTARKWVRRFQSEGVDGLNDRSSRPHRIISINAPADDSLQQRVIALLHIPPAQQGFNRTTWRLVDLRAKLAEQGCVTSLRNIKTVIHRAGFRYRQARVALTSHDPEYQQKVSAIKQTLANLQDDEAFFSIDEFGPFAVKMRGGKSLQPPGQTRVVPQWQASRGALILSAALELRSNQLSHFFSTKKNTNETIALIEVLRRDYRRMRRIYLSWDAAPWHESKALLAKIQFLNEWAEHDDAPQIILRPLPSCSQFLNVIESVFSGMSRAVLHNSDYASLSDAQEAIRRYIEARNSAFKKTPQKAGNAIWGKERVASKFSEAGTCKDPWYSYKREHRGARAHGAVV